MKIISLVVFAVALVGTWKAAYSARPITESMHVGIQEDLKRIISEFIQKKLPEAKNIVFEKFWTETLKKNKVRAYFVYSFEDTNQVSGNARTQIEGFGTLHKVKESDQEITWSFDDIQVKDTRIEFKDSIKIKAGVDDTPAAE